MVDDDRDRIDYKRSTFGSFGVRAPKRKCKKQAGDKRVPSKPRGEEGGGGGRPLGRRLIRN